MTRHDAAARIDDAEAHGTHVRASRPADGPGPGTAPAVVRGADPRLTHSGGAAPGLMALQRTAGNAAVAALVGRPAVQRAVEIDELSTSVTVDDTAAQAGATGAGAAGATPAGGSPVTSDGANTTITGAQITLDAAMTQANGVLRADTIIADNVVASSYTPGAGNVW